MDVITVIDHTAIERVLFAGTNQYKYANEMPHCPIG